MANTPYAGPERLIFALDCGTTMTAVAFVHLIPGAPPKISVVNRWPSEDAGNAKVQTAVRYDPTGHAVSFGSSAVEDIDEVPGSALAQYFKLHLHPQEMRIECALSVPPLPPNVTIDKVYSDFLGFVFGHARGFFQSSTLDGKGLWQRLSTTFEVVFAIPNGWSETQQAFLRSAAVAAGIMPADNSHDRLTFVSEAEASVHFAMEHMNIAHLIQKTAVFAVLDAGGSTVDTAVYHCDDVAPQLRLTEVTSTECVQAGSALVDQSFRHFLREYLVGSKYSSNEHITEMTRIFESKTKRRFTGDEDQVLIHFGRSSDNDKKKGIKMGRLSLKTTDVVEVFEAQVRLVAASLSRILRRTSESGKECKTVLLVGGFAESPFLRSAMQESLAGREVEFLYSDEPTRKAAAVGACLWKTNAHVVARASRCTYCTVTTVAYNPVLPGHLIRSHKVYTGVNGINSLHGGLTVLATKGHVVDAEHSVKTPLCQNYDNALPTLESYSLDLLASDEKEAGVWARDPEGVLMPGLRRACTLSADLSGMRGSLKKRKRQDGKPYWQMEFNVEVFFGGTTLRALLSWTENGVTKKGPVTIIADSLA